MANDNLITARPMRVDKYTPTLNESQILYYRSHPVEAVRDLLSIDLIWFQRIILRMMWFKRFPLLNLGRGLGKSFIIAVFTCLSSMLYPGLKVGIIAPVFRQANYVFDVIDEIYSGSAYLQSCTLRNPSRTAGQSILRFYNNSFVEALPLGDGNKIRGRRYHLAALDEYAQLDSQIIKLVIRPMLNIKRANRENKIVIASTAYYRWNHYWDTYVLYALKMMEGNPNYAIAEFDYLDLQNTKNSPYQIDPEVIDMQKADMTHEEFQMENMALFISDTAGFISMRLIDECTPKKGEEVLPELFQPLEQNTATYVMGVDCARVAGGDNFAMVLLKLQGNKKEVRAVFTHNGSTYQEMTHTIRLVLSNFNVSRLHVGAGGGGLTLKDLLAESWKNEEGEDVLPILDMEDDRHETMDGVHILKLVQESNKKNNEMYMGLKSDLQHKRILFPVTVHTKEKDDVNTKKVYSEIASLKRELAVIEAVPQGLYHKFIVPNKYRKDRATALVLAIDAANELSKTDKTETSGDLPVGMFI